MTLSDTGPLIALIDEDDPNHEVVLEAVRSVLWPLLTTEACLTEALYLLGRSTGWPGQDALLRFVDDGSLAVSAPSPDSQSRARTFMRRFRDQPCDYADATLLVVAEDTGLRSVLTLDQHFYAYRLSNNDPLTVIR